MSDTATRLAGVRERVGDAALRSGRRPEDVRLIAVSKTFPMAAIREAYEAGQRDFGENKVQETLQKIEAAADMQIGWHLIGHLQSNKVRKAVGGVGWIHAVDSLDLLRRVDEVAREQGGTVRVLLQVDLALEATKHGAPVEEVPALLSAAREMRGAIVSGLMLLPPQVDRPEDARPWFQRLRELRDQWVEHGTPATLLQELSMGMSHDFEVAIEEGATMVRVGSAIFGSRFYAPTGQ